MPLVEKTGIVVLCLLAAPHVETLVHHDQSHRIAHVKQFWGRRVVRAADGIHAHRLQLRQFAVQSVLVEGSAQTAEIMMLADTVQFEVLTVEPEARLCIELETAETRCGLVGIHYLTCNLHHRTHLIDVGRLTAPEHGLADSDARLQAFRPSDDLAIRGYQRVFHLALAFERHLDSEPALAFHHTGIGEDAPVTDMRVGRCREPHMTVDTTARVPAGIRLITVIDPHCHHIVTLTHIRRDVVLKA